MEKQAQKDGEKTKSEAKKVRFVPVQNEQELRVSAATILFSIC